MDLCSPYVVIRLLAAVGAGMFVMGLWLVGVADQREAIVAVYNTDVEQWSSLYQKEFAKAAFVLELGVAMANASTHHYPLVPDQGVEDENMIPAGYFPDLEPYTPLQFISDRIMAENVLHSTKPHAPLAPGKEMESLINVTLSAMTRLAGDGVGNATRQRLPVGTFRMFGDWPAAPHVCDGGFGSHDAGQSRDANGACQVLRAVRSLCLVVSWRGKEEGWAWRSGGKGCYGDDPAHGARDWVLANSLDDLEPHGDSEQLADWQTGKFDFGAGVFEEHDPFLMMQGGTKLDVLMSSPELEADACLICGSILVTIFVVHWTVCEKMDDGELDRELTRILIATGAAAPPPDRATADRIFRRRRERERRRAEAQAEARAQAEEARALDARARRMGGGGEAAGEEGRESLLTPEQRVVAQGGSDGDEEGLESGGGPRDSIEIVATTSGEDGGRTSSSVRDGGALSLQSGGGGGAVPVVSNSGGDATLVVDQSVEGGPGGGGGGGRRAEPDDR